MCRERISWSVHPEVMEARHAVSWRHIQLCDQNEHGGERAARVLLDPQVDYYLKLPAQSVEV